MRPASPHRPVAACTVALRPCFASLLFGLASLGASAQAVPPAKPASSPQPPGLASNSTHGGTALDGRPFQLRAGDGRVRVLMFWRTDCAVCLSKMPELRANAEGWRKQPFDLVLINTDPRREDAIAYDRLRRDLTAGQGPLVSAWAGDVRLPAAWQGSGRLPLTLVVDREGRVVARHEGRVPPELWDQVADLLP